MYRLILVVLFIFAFIMKANSQWSSNNAINLQVADTIGEQSLPKIVNTSDGGCYVAWFDHRGSSYAVYLQRLNQKGIKQFPNQGLLISNNPQSSSLVDWDMTVDDSNNAILVFTDTRNGSQINPFAYKINQQGNFLWGPNGITLSNDFSVFQPNPKVVSTSDGEYVIAWIYTSSPRKIALQRLSSGGTKLWGTNPIYLSGTGTENLDYSAIIRSDNGNIIAMWSGYTGSFMSPGNYRIYSQKFSTTGSPVWNATQDTIYGLFRVSGTFVPRLISDGNNGAIYAWVDDRNNANRRSTFIQHYTSTATRLFPLNGAEVSTAPNLLKLDPWASYVPSTNEIFVFWYMTNINQDSYAVYGQKLSSSGTRQWGDSGIAFRQFSNAQPSFIRCTTKDTTAVVSFIESIFASLNDYIKGFLANVNGTIGWGGSINTYCSVLSDKGRLSETMDVNKVTKLVWSDNRIDANGIYAQNINDDGSLGNQAISLNVTIGIEGMWNGTTQVQDTMRLYLRNSNAPYDIIDSSTVYLSSTGNAIGSFVYASNGNYFIQSKHRNALETWSASDISFMKGGTTSYDFTTAQSQAYGSNQVLKLDKYCIYSGDVNQDETIDISDLSLVYNALKISLVGYVPEDLDGNNFVDVTDLSIDYNNVKKSIEVMRPF